MSVGTKKRRVNTVARRNIGRVLGTITFMLALFGNGVAKADGDGPSTVNRLYTVAFGIQALKAPLRVSESMPLVSRMVTLPAVSCPVCNGEAGEYSYDEVWEVDQGMLDAPRTDSVSGAGTKQQAWVFRPLALGEVRGIEIMIRQQDRHQGVDCQPGTGAQGQLQCQLTGKSGASVPAVPVEVGLLVVSPSVTPGDLQTLNRPFLTRVVTFKIGTKIISQHKDSITVSGSTRLASCNISAGELVFNLPARSVIAGSASSVNARVLSSPPAEAVERILTFACIGNTRLDIRFTPLTGTLDNDRILRAQSMQGVQSQLGFQLWYHSSEWGGADSNYRLAKWDSVTTESLLAQTPSLVPRPASAADIVLKFRAGYARAADVRITEADAGPIMARGLYTISYQ